MSRNPKPRTPPKSLRVLCAEDNEAVAMLIKYALERRGHSVELAPDGGDAFARMALTADAFDLLVTDNEMPGMSGLVLVEKLRDTGFEGKIIVHCSPLNDRDKEAYHALNVDHFFAKPARLDELLAVVECLGEFAAH